VDVLLARAHAYSACPPADSSAPSPPMSHTLNDRQMQRRIAEYGGRELTARQCPPETIASDWPTRRTPLSGAGVERALRTGPRGCTVRVYSKYHTHV
jgi:hypothetical protein